MRAGVLVLTKLPGWLPVKTRLVPVLGERGARECYGFMLRATVELARRAGAEPVLCYSPPGADPHAALPGFSDCAFRPVEGGDGAVCLEHALDDAWRRVPGRPLIALGGDAPDLPVARLLSTDAALAGGADAVLVPTGDGGFSCLGLRAPVPGLAGGFSYGGADAFEALRRFLESCGRSVAILEPWPDVDTPEDLAAYRSRYTGGPKNGPA